MSLVSLAIRLAASRALRQKTFAGDRVYDSAITPLDLTVSAERKPFIVVTSDQERAKVTGRDVSGTDRELDLVLELALATFVAKDTGVEVLIPHTDEGMEVALDLMVRQTLRALISGEGDWSKVFLAFVPRLHRVETKRGAGADNGVRFAARQMLIVCDTIADPPFGLPLPGHGPWAELLRVMESDPATAPLKALLEDAIPGALLSSWEAARAELGLMEAEARGIGILPAGTLG